MYFDTSKSPVASAGLLHGGSITPGERYEGQQIVEAAVEVSFAQGPANAMQVQCSVVGCPWMSLIAFLCWCDSCQVAYRLAATISLKSVNDLWESY